MKKISRFATVFILAASFALPLFVLLPSGSLVAHAATDPITGETLTTQGSPAPTGTGSVNTQWIQYYKDTILWAVNYIFVPVLIAIAFITFLWGVYKYFIYGADNDTERETGKKFVLWGIIGFVIISSIWGLVNIVGQTLIPSSAGNAHPNYPTL